MTVCLPDVLQRISFETRPGAAALLLKGRRHVLEMDSGEPNIVYILA